MISGTDARTTHIASTRMHAKCKNAVRVAPAPFDAPVNLVSFMDGGVRRYGHLQSDCRVLPEMADAAVSVPCFTRVLSDVPSIPLGAYMTHGAVTDTEMDFFVFESPHPYLYLRGGDLDAVGKDKDTVTHGTVALIDRLYTETCLPPWREFFIGSKPDDRVCVVRATDTVPDTAAHYLEKGYIVACSGVPARFVRVQGLQLKWVPDSKCAVDMSTIADTVPGIDSAAAREVYARDLQVQRQMLFWGMLAGCVMASSTSPAATGMCEPLQSYIRTLQAVKRHRKANGSVEKCTIAQDVFRYNAAARPSAEQQQHAMALYYWACIHPRSPADDQKEAYRAALRMYIMFGYVLVRKRAYEFHAATVEKKMRAVRLRKAAWLLSQ